MWPGLLKSEGLDAEEARDRAVNARSCAEIPVVVPDLRSVKGYVSHLWEDLWGNDLRTVFVVDRNGVSGSVTILVLSYHHWDFQLL